MEQEPGQEPESDGPAGPQPPSDSSYPGDTGSPRRRRFQPWFRGRADAGDRCDGAEGESVFGPWDGLEGTLGAAREREELLAGFAPGGVWDQHRPGPELAAAVARAAGPDWRCGLATGPELVGLLRATAALQSWSGAGLLGVIRALIRDDDPAFLGRSRHGDLPDEWDESLVHEIALALAVSAPSAGRTTRAAWELGARLPGVELLLRDGTLDLPRARLVAEVFAELSDEDAARAEGLLLPRLAEPPRKTYTQVERLATAIAAEVDPGLAGRRRRAAERHLSRVVMFREPAGTAALAGRDLPADETLAAFARVSARAQVYKESGAFPGEGMDRLRATAYLDILNEIAAADRIAYGRLIPETAPADADAARLPADSPPPTRPTATPPPETATHPMPRTPTHACDAPDSAPQRRAADASDDTVGRGGSDCPCGECDGRCAPPDDGDFPDDSDFPDDGDFPDAGDGGPGDGEPGGPGSGGPRGGSEPPAPGGSAGPGADGDSGPRRDKDRPPGGHGGPDPGPDPGPGPVIPVPVPVTLIAAARESPTTVREPPRPRRDRRSCGPPTGPRRR